jgi:hypothetical protein
MENNLVKADFPMRNISYLLKSKTALPIFHLSKLAANMTVKESLPETPYRVF